jgi:hypothetical protein
MIRRLSVIVFAALVVAGASAAGESAWFDMENCEMCSNMSQELMKNLSWENVDISNGIVCITTVNNPEYLAEYRKMHAAMVETGARLAQGEEMKLCGSCTAFGKCMTKNPHQEYAETSSGDVWIITSDKPEVVAELHAWTKRNREEMAMMKAESHEGEGH